MVAQSLQQALDKGNYLEPFQSGFRSGHGMELVMLLNDLWWEWEGVSTKSSLCSPEYYMRLEKSNIESNNATYSKAKILILGNLTQWHKVFGEYPDAWKNERQSEKKLVGDKAAK